MPCYFPVTAYYARERNPSGKRSLVFDETKSHSGIPVKIPCSKCIGCRLERSRQWALRCMHENKLHPSSRFVTLTYDDSKLPLHGSLDRRDPQLFLKRLRFHYGPGIRFFGCGEYGSTTRRPHYHLILFNVAFEDERKFSSNERGEPLRRSAILEKIWTSGNSVVGDVTFDSAAYVARYCVDKVDGELAEKRYSKVLDDGTIVRLAPEFPMMSLKPGIGHGAFIKYGPEIYTHDSCVMKGKECRPPRFYDKKIEASFPAFYEQMKRERRAEVDRAENTHARRRVREEVVRQNVRRFRRDVE